MGKLLSVDGTGSICIVEDDDAVRGSTKLLLETMGYSVREYASGEEFLAGMQGHEPGCLVLDYNLKGMNGLEVLRHVRARGLDTPAIIITANARRLGPPATHPDVLAILLKPVPATDLLTWVEKALAPA